MECLSSQSYDNCWNISGKTRAYFSSVSFLKWDDVTAPIIEISEDGTMAYTIVDKIVKVTYEDETGSITEGKPHFAWTAIYKK